MRLWSLHPRYLDVKGLVALWREALLAQEVLSGDSKGYRSHPQLIRFRHQTDPLAAIAAYLRDVQQEAERRGYRFDSSKIIAPPGAAKVPVTDGQLRYELGLLKSKLRLRDPSAYRRIESLSEVEPHPLFRVIVGDLEEWEAVGKRKGSA